MSKLIGYDCYKWGLPRDKAIPTGNSVVLRPVTREEVKESDLILLDDDTKKNSVVTFEIIAVGPEVKDKERIRKGWVALPIVNAMDVVAQKNAFVLVEEKDIRDVFNPEDLQKKPEETDSNE